MSNQHSRFTMDPLAVLRRMPTPKPDVRDAIADSLEEQLEAAQAHSREASEMFLRSDAYVGELRTALERIAAWPPHDGMLALCEFARDALSNPASERCPVCEGLDQPGLLHNERAPYCSQAQSPAKRPKELLEDEGIHDAFDANQWD